MAEVTFTREIAKETCKTLNKIKNIEVEFTGGIKAEAAIYNSIGSVSIDYIPQHKKFYLELEKEVHCSSCGRVVVSFQADSLSELITIVKCFEF